MLEMRNNAEAVSYITKVLKWEQITTARQILFPAKRCFLYYKGTKMRANHNLSSFQDLMQHAVSYITKVITVH